MLADVGDAPGVGGQTPARADLRGVRRGRRGGTMAVGVPEGAQVREEALLLAQRERAPERGRSSRSELRTSRQSTPCAAAAAISRRSARS
jgi:hypothetical protein